MSFKDIHSLDIPDLLRQHVIESHSDIVWPLLEPTGGVPGHRQHASSSCRVLVKKAVCYKFRFITFYEHAGFIPNKTSKRKYAKLLKQWFTGLSSFTTYK